MDKELLMHNRRDKKHPDHNLGRNRQKTTCAYCSKTYSATDKVIMRLELLLPQYGGGAKHRKTPEAPDWRSPKRMMGQDTSQKERKHARDPPAKTRNSPINANQK